MNENNNQQINNVVQPNNTVANNQPVNPAPSVNPNVVPNNQVNEANNNFNQGYIEPPKKKNSFVTYLIIFLILAVAGVGGYYAGSYIYHATHDQQAEK